MASSSRVCVLLSAPDAVLKDPGGRDGPNVTTLKKSAAVLQEHLAGLRALLEEHRLNAQHGAQGVCKASPVRRVARCASAAGRFTERLGSSDQHVEYRAVNSFAGARAGTVLLRAYQADPYLPDAERTAQRSRISNAYAALSRMPGHPGIVGARDFFPTDAEDRWILVTEDVPGQALRLHIDKPNLALTLDQKLHVVGDLLGAL